MFKDNDTLVNVKYQISDTIFWTLLESRIDVVAIGFAFLPLGKTLCGACSSVAVPIGFAMRVKSLYFGWVLG